MLFPANKRLVARAIALLLLCQFSPLIQAEEAGTPYGIKGAGASSCSRFVTAVADKDSNQLSSYAGWVDGFITALNMSRADTFDLVPWQSSETLLSALHRFCQQAAMGEEQTVPFHVAVQIMTRSLNAGRLQFATTAVVAQRQEKAVVVYQYVLDELRSGLVQQGFLKVSSAGRSFDNATAEAIHAFQKQSGLRQTGLPDQATLSSLLSKSWR